MIATLGHINRGTLRLTRLAWVVLLGFVATSVCAQQWTTLGPDGGDARSLAYDPSDPDRIFLGTDTGTIFLSTDGGRNWSRFAHLGTSDDYVLDHIVIDEQNSDIMFVSAWSVRDSKSGDLFRTRDGGTTWNALSPMHGKSIRALAIAASDSKVITAGSLQGVYRSSDGGNKWELISPGGDDEIKNIESIAVDPDDPAVVYAGTWHLAWKTTDGGASWGLINAGMEDDSDVFSIILDSTNPSVVFASACSGIYRSERGGGKFHKIQGIPYAARRTHVLKQAPGNPKIIYAGTTAGLWKTIDGGRIWKRVTSPDIVVNDVLIDPRSTKRVLLATDRGGVIVSEDGARTFAQSNHGYAHRYVTSIVADKDDPDTIFVGVANDREWGGVFSLEKGSPDWQQRSTGLSGRDVFALKQASSGALIAGTSSGIFILDRNKKAWRASKTSAGDDPPPPPRPVRRAHRRRAVEEDPPPAATGPDMKVNDLEIRDGQWLAATSMGLFISTDEGKSWSGGPILDRRVFVSVQSSGDLQVVATEADVLVSKDKGTVWQLSSLPRELFGIRSVTVTADADILVASQGGGFRSSDGGQSWARVLNGLPERNISSISYDEYGQRLLATSNESSVIYESKDGGHSWRRGPDPGYPLRHISVIRGRMMAATPFDGVIVQP